MTITINGHDFDASNISEEELRLLIDAAKVNKRALPFSEAIRLSIGVIRMTDIHPEIRSLADAVILAGSKVHDGENCSEMEEHLRLVMEYEQGYHRSGEWNARSPFIHGM
jgi:hypothetical protein